MKNHVVSLYDASGLAVMAWAEAGYEVYCYDLLNEAETRSVGKGKIHFIKWDARDEDYIEYMVARHAEKAAFLCGFPPCTDLAVSGAAWFAKKKEANPNYREEAMALVMRVPELGERLSCPWFAENPVSVVSSQWRKPDHIFHPWEFGGYLPENDVHPFWPDYINARDAYPKKTCYWSGGGFRMPDKKPVPVAEGYSLQHKKLGGRSAKTKSIRSMSPRGIGIAVFKENKADA